MTDWGARPLSAASTLFDPLHYNNGAVWPFVTGFTSLAQYNYHNQNAGKFALDAIARTGFDFSRGRNPEVLSGRLYKPLDTAVPQQFFATSMVLTPLIRGLLGLDVDAPRRKLRIAPHLPPDWDSVFVSNIPLGADKIGISIIREGGALTLRLSESPQPPYSLLRGLKPLSSPVEVEFSPALPLGATVALPPADVTRTEGDVHGTVRVRFDDMRAELRVPYSGGWSITATDRSGPRVGERSHKARVLSERLTDGTYRVLVEGLAGQRGYFTLMPPDPTSKRRIVLEAVPGAEALIVPRPGSTTRFDVSLLFPSTGANADGYTSAQLIFTQGAP
jgi:hypothetical protein